ncbi:MAG: DUF2268 domain-containing putative Zn-dependent protease [Candidatus Paceibacterota bacterium]
MKVVDLMENYIESYLAKDNLSEYENSYPELFEHYFTYWGDRDSFKGALTETETRERVVLIKKHLAVIEQKLNNFGFNVALLEVILFVGQGWTNGHAFKHDSTFKVFLPVEAYQSDTQVLTFVPHEIIHALHYQKQPDFYFKNKEEKERFSRLLITEGLATLLTKKIMGLSEKEALWADYLDSEDLEWWMRECEKWGDGLYKFAISNFKKSSDSLMFYTADKNDIFKYRAGYYIGMKILEKMIDNKGVRDIDLLTTPREKLEGLVLNVLRQSA